MTKKILGDELLHADRQTDVQADGYENMTMKTAAFGNFANVPNKKQNTTSAFVQLSSSLSFTSRITS
jgi:hypothetical protein